MSKVRTSAISGIDAHSVDVEVLIKSGQPHFAIIGLGDNAVKESRDRVSCALKQSGFKMPVRLLVNLAPAELKKEGSYFDLAIAVAVLAASQQVKFASLPQTAFYGELSLDGRIRPVRGIIAMVINALQSGLKEVVVPCANYHEASLIKGINITPASSLVELVHYLNSGELKTSFPQNMSQVKPAARGRLSEVWGQVAAKHAMCIAAAGGHNLLMIGPPGCGKSMLASRFSSLLPPMNSEETLESVKIHSVAGLPLESLVAGHRPYRSPHHVVSDIGLIGGGGNPKPGEISLAHNGILFLDEFPEYRRSAIEGLRSPLEAGEVRITRARASQIFPARFQLVAAMNPCPCGRLGVSNVSCLCSRQMIATYLKKLSEPILDRIDLHVELEAVPISVMMEETSSEERDEDSRLFAKVMAARELQMRRSGKLNANLSNSEIKKIVRIQDTALRLLEQANQTLGFSARSYLRILKVAMTIADISAERVITSTHVAEALSFRCIERLRNYTQPEAANSY